MNICFAHRFNLCKLFSRYPFLASSSAAGALLIFSVKLARFIGPALALVVGSNGLEPSTSRLSGARSSHLSYEPICCFHFGLKFLSLCPLRGFPLWWRWWDSNPWPPACRAGALPTELHPHIFMGVLLFVFAYSLFFLQQSLKIEQQSMRDNRFLHVCFCFDFCPAVYFSQVTFSIERRWSSRTFRYGYLVTT